MESLNLFEYSRGATMVALGSVADAEWDKQPTGFSNTIRWNAGHVYMTAEDYLHKADKNYEITHPEWYRYFIDGSKLSDWDDQVPSVSEILDALKEQGERILNYFNGKQQNEATEVEEIRYLKLDTVEAALQFVTWHEGIHLGIIKSMQNVLK